ncbi:nucleoside triphosphate pyrophosphohydrolase [Halobacillus halophilus]|uniref:nucleoside triphosphate pyrophosphohydrolase n=1 Tax=Halobacillus halophilus TaxID=1570 RepID=UPI00136BE22B|nr:nucleoside triphosphate pyrophosphohydrolase [Halobacillus halophilus]MYL31941.1 nucleoside triphosphate pyrophosphohydrolase [Halobacillus halophilus]
MQTIKIFGLGASGLEQLPLGVYRQLTQTGAPLTARTLDHPVVRELVQEGLSIESFDTVYEDHQQFGGVYEEITTRLLERPEEVIFYLVPGHPMMAEKTVQLLLEKEKDGAVNVEIEGGQSFLDATFTTLGIDPIEGFQLVDATDIKREQLTYTSHLILCQVYDAMTASEVKLTLLEDLPAAHPVTIVTAAGGTDEHVRTVPLEDLDRSVEVDNLTSVYVPPVEKTHLNHQFFRLREVIRVLRSPEGCPWDRKQTHESLRKYLIEETYEFIDAVNQMDDDQMVEELGDVLLQVMLHSQIGEDEGYFTIDDVIVSVTDKMIRRHPHVFGDVRADTTDEVLTNWEAIKQQEKGEASPRLLDSVPESFPALLQAEELQKKAAKVGFDWEDVTPVLEKVEEEWQEFQEALTSGDREEMEKEFGDWLFAIANLARHYRLNSENALQRTNRKFRMRLSSMEESVEQSGRKLEDYDLDALEELWVQAKAKHKGAE